MNTSTILWLTIAFLAGLAGGALLAHGFGRRAAASDKPGGVMDMHLTLNVLNRMSTAPNIGARESESIVFLARYLLVTSSQHSTRQALSAQEAQQVLVAFVNMVSWYARGAYAEMQVDCEAEQIRCDVGEMLRAAQKLIREAVEEGRDVLSVRIEGDPDARGQLRIAIRTSAAETSTAMLRGGSEARAPKDDAQRVARIAGEMG